MFRSRLHTRLRRLERIAYAHAAGRLHVWRLPEESDAMALARCEIDAADFPQVHVHVWPGIRVFARLARPPAPLWVSQTQPAIADLEHRLHEGLKQRML